MDVRMRNATLVATLMLAAAGCSRDRGDDRTVKTESDAGTLASTLSGDSAARRGVALVRVANAVATTRDLVLRADESHVMPAVKFGTVGAYQPIDETWVSFQVGDTVAGTFVPLNSNRELLTNGDRYTLVVLRNAEGTGFETRIVRDRPAASPGKAAVRFVHAAPGIREVIVQPRGSSPLVEGLDYGDDYVDREIDPWSGVLEVRADQANAPVLVTPKAIFEAGKAYTVVLVRAAKGKVDLFWFADSAEP